MKKKLESELISIAHRILKLKGKEDVLKMYAEVAALYEKLSVLKFAHENFEDEIPTIGNDSSFFGMLDSAFNNKVSDNIEIEDRIYVNLDDIEDDDIMEPAIEKIKDMVAQMPMESQQVDEIIKAAPASRKAEKTLDDITAGFTEMPEFEPVSKTEADTNGKKSLNEKLKGGDMTIGLNDKLAFIKHLFNGNAEEFEDVLSQLNSSASLEEAKTLIQVAIKPNFDGWEGKEEYEARLMELIEGKFD